MPQPTVIGRLAEQQSPAIAAHIHSWIRRGRDYLQVVIGTTAAADAADALDLAWQSFRKAAGDDAGSGTWRAPWPRSAPALHDLARQPLAISEAMTPAVPPQGLSRESCLFRSPAARRSLVGS